MQLDLAEKRLEEAKQQKELAEVQARQLVDAANLKLRQIEEKKKLLDDDQARLLKLAADQLAASKAVMARLVSISADQLTGEFVGQLEIDRQQVAIQEAELKLEQQRVVHKQSQDELVFAEEVAKTELKTATQSLQAAMESKAVEIAESQIAVLKEQAEAARIMAPTDGVITAINVRAGETSVQQPIIEMADLTQLVCEVEINELDAALVNQHDRATIRSRAFGAQELTGYVKRKSNVVGRPQLKPFDPLAPVDYRSVTAVIELDEASIELAKEWLQLQVDVMLKVGSGKAASSTETEPEQSQEG
jgi:HlyD family secretion protein